MRPYPTDSPQAAARLVALSLIADGHLQPSEMQALLRSRAHEKLGLSEADLHEVVHGVCKDLLSDAAARGDDRCQIDADTLAWLFEQVRHPVLRRKVLRLVMLCIDADDCLHEGEMRILLAAIDHWNLRPEGLESLMMAPGLPVPTSPARMRPAPSHGTGVR